MSPQTADGNRAWVDVGGAEDFPPGRVVPVAAGGRALILCRLGPEYYAADNRCPHQGRPLTGGRLMGRDIQCPAHGASFDMSDGRVRCGPAIHPLTVHPVRLENGRVLVSLPPAG